MLRGQSSRRQKLLLLIPEIINIVIISTSLFSPICFSYDENNIFHRGPLGYSTHITLSLYLIILIVISMRTKNRTSFFEYQIIYIMSAVIAATGLIEAIYSIRTIGRTATVLCTIFYYMFFQTEEYNHELENESSRIQGLLITNSHEPMTGLLNKSAFSDACRKILEEKLFSSIAYIFIDIDNFKRINDTLGHLSGDAAIIDTAHILSSSFDEDDLVCRFGGDEFCICLLDISFDELSEKLEDCCIALQREYSTEQFDGLIHVTSSIGAIYASASDNPGYLQLQRAADKALYEAKKAGRNRVVINSL